MKHKKTTNQIIELATESKKIINLLVPSEIDVKNGSSDNSTFFAVDLYEFIRTAHDNEFFEICEEMGWMNLDKYIYIRLVKSPNN